MPDAVIVDAVRTATGKRNGTLSGWHPVDLSAHVLRALMERTGVDPAVIDDVIWGCVTQTGEQAANIGRNVALAAGFPEDVPGVTVDRQCGSSQQAAHFAAAAAQDEGRFAQQIVPVPVTHEDGTHTLHVTDEGVRRGGSMEKLAALQPAFTDDGVITAGNSSQISDGAAALLVTTMGRARQLGLRPIARFHTFVLAGADPIYMLTAPLPATRKILHRSGLRVDEIGAFEVNEAFACVPLAWLIDTGADPKAVNPNGGAIALGHPLGRSGARLMTILVHHMVDNGVHYGLQTMCEGGGTANAMILELL